MKVFRKIAVAFLMVFAWQGVVEGATINWDPSSYSGAGATYTIPDDGNDYVMDNDVTLTNDLIINGKFYTGTEYNLTNNHTIDVNGKLYVYGTIDNGGGSAGVINIDYPGAMYLLGGEVENKHVDSELNVNQGGSLYNYYGTVDLGIGGVDSLEINAGGKFHNARGAHPASFTINAGGEFLDQEVINLDQDLDVDYTWTITKKATINGYGNSITFGPNGKIILQGPKASLLLDDVTVNNISGNKIDCTDNKSTLSIHNVIWHQDGNYSFTYGKFYVTGEWLILGDDTIFSYESSQTSTIEDDASMHMVLNTLKYDTGSNNLLVLKGATSSIHLEHAMLRAAQSYVPTTGRLLVTGLGTLWGDGTLNVTGLGDFDVDGSVHRVGSVII